MVNTLTERGAEGPHAVLLATAQIMAVGPNGAQILVRALLDQGSEASFVTENVVQVLALPRHRVNVPLSGIGASSLGRVRSATRVTVQSTRDPDFRLEVDALVLPRLTNTIPAKEIVNLDLGLHADLPLADPNFHRPASVALILGADCYAQVLRPKMRRLMDGRAIAQDTALGWIMSGSVNGTASRRAGDRCAFLSTAFADRDVDLRVLLQNFWELEEIPENPLKLDPDNQWCEDQFRTTHRRTSQGRYIVQLPVRSDLPPASEETRKIALGSLLSMEKRFTRDVKLAHAYFDFMQEYEALGHMEPVPRLELNNPGAWYLPHHAVVQSTLDRWKLRVVFDASRRTAHHGSLKQHLIPGPSLQKDLALILTNWRQYHFAFTADIVKMYRQILVDPLQYDLLRILWRRGPSEAVKEYRLKTVTYGTASAPFLAIRTLKQLAQDEGARFPLAAVCLLDHSFLDDIFSGSSDWESAKAMSQQLTALLKTGGFELSKCAATHEDLIPVNQRTSPAKDPYKLIEPVEYVHTLGLLWNNTEDRFVDSLKTLNVSPCEHPTQPPTKRSVLSRISRTFDPLGWASPVTISLKILMQDMWMLKIDWDTPLPEEAALRWNDYCTWLPSLSEMSIPRWLGPTTNNQCEIHGFSDASKRAYAAVVYLRVRMRSGEWQVSLLMAKSKVAPVKTISIPNLELCGASLLVRICQHLRRLDFLKRLPVHAWSDSKVVLDWLRRHPSYWKTFVANRVSYIQTELPTALWHQVPSEDNPADLATRGLNPKELRSSHLWWAGPGWLSGPSSAWPESTGSPVVQHASTQSFSTAVLPATEGLDKVAQLISRFSNLVRLIRITAWCLRFARNCRLRRDHLPTQTSFLTTTELVGARLVVIKLTQADHFHAEIAILRGGQQLSNRHYLTRLNPFVDADGVLRLGGRLDHSSLAYSAKHPPILPKCSHLTGLFVQYAHLAALHGGISLTLSVLRSHVWVINGLGVVKKHVRNCFKCRRARPRLMTQLMGNLPVNRVTPPERAFTTTGVDYAGPIKLRTTKGRGHKSTTGYIALFVCFASKAVHLEAVSDLTSAAFLAAYRRFVGRRGVCRTIFSDHGTNFQGAPTELRRMFLAASEFYGEVAASLANEGTSWSFIPPNAPHFGGLWEAGVKATKHHLLRVIRDHTLTFEELSTVLVEIEACLNSRPLWALSEDPDDLQAWTPASLLHGGSSMLIPEPKLPNLPENRLTRYQLLQRIRNDYWKRWSREYLHHLQERSKWRGTTENFAVGELVVVRDDRYPPAKWPLGRITEVHPGTDGLVRVVTVRTATSTLRRPITRLSPLPIQDPH